MKRFLIFILLGPFLGFTVFIIRDIAGGMIFGGPMGFLFGLPFAYLFGQSKQLKVRHSCLLQWRPGGQRQGHLG
ncbi:MAG TPA: hypothetical protein VI386_26490 [Candidatus Sulfotelmatobacter sp.]|jgi:hypothetical protein